MTRFAVSALGVAGLAGSSLAQAVSTDQVRAELRLVSQQGVLGGEITSHDVDQHPDATSEFGVVRRFELQYRLIDLNTTDDFEPRGLAATTARLVATGGTLRRATLSQIEAGGTAWPVSQPVNLDADTSAISPIGTAGLHRPFRGGIPGPAPNNNNGSNGILEPTAGAARTIRSINAVTLSATDQFAPDDPGGGWYGLYSVEFLPTASVGTLTALLDADAITRNAFAFFTEGDPVPVTSPVWNSDMVVVRAVPAPGGMLLMFAGCAITVRRRRSLAPATPLRAGRESVSGQARRK